MVVKLIADKLGTNPFGLAPIKGRVVAGRIKWTHGKVWPDEEFEWHGGRVLPAWASIVDLHATTASTEEAQSEDEVDKMAVPKPVEAREGHVVPDDIDVDDGVSDIPEEPLPDVPEVKEEFTLEAEPMGPQTPAPSAPAKSKAKAKAKATSADS